MDDTTFTALIVDQAATGKMERHLGSRKVADLPPGEVLVAVHYSSLNYKDALSASGNKGVTRTYPHTPGIDAAGVVMKSDTPTVQPGDKVIVTSYDLGMNTPGGFGQYIRVPAEWVVPLPSGLDLRESMILGTAGLTAGLSVTALVDTIAPEDGEILVTGATGGVGSLAVAILARLGYTVAAVSGKPEAAGFLETAGAKRILSRELVLDGGERVLMKSVWAGAIDTVGGQMLAAVVKSTKPWGIVTCCGNVASPDLPLNVFPFILRGVSLVGIDSQNCPMTKRLRVWEQLATAWKPFGLDNFSREVSLVELDREIETILEGGQTGRVVVRLID